jgi:hypothetical protein
MDNSLEEKYFHFEDLCYPKYVEITKDDLNKGAELLKGNGLVLVYWEIGKDNVRVSSLELGDDGQWTRHEMAYSTNVSELTKGDDRYYVPIMEYMIGTLEMLAKIHRKETKH